MQNNARKKHEILRLKITQNKLTFNHKIMTYKLFYCYSLQPFLLAVMIVTRQRLSPMKR